ncbi:hypothetical protein [Halioxenophilus sp. WMMB6]|uniref:hypothetical protein n=1 Tax=Halioxenophilus sp. WMMB6 TaxID=3073815 RepID=UPI00295ED05B|nr:hypothetical protein [Halioxenophilus sp. WMMB6]
MSNEKKQAAKSRHLLFVVGMHRSGTSALTAALCQAGASVGNDTLAAVAGINDEGFWEDRQVVELNEALLEYHNLSWFDLDAADTHICGNAPLAERGKAILAKGFGEGCVEVIKDPRLCLTLPFWLDICHTLAITASVCFIERSSDEVAQSLHKRDAFPIDYCLQLIASYQQAIANVKQSLPSYAAVVYDQLITATDKTINGVIASLELPLTPHQVSGTSAVKPALRHHQSNTDAAEPHPNRSPDSLLKSMTHAFVERGIVLTELGQQHSDALAVIQKRDQQLEQTNEQLASVGEEHSTALATITLRDEQLADAQGQLAKLGKEHAHALNVVGERDQQLTLLNQELTRIGELHSLAQATVQQRDEQINQINSELSQVQRELAIHKSWRRKILASLGLMVRENKK